MRTVQNIWSFLFAPCLSAKEGGRGRWACLLRSPFLWVSDPIIPYFFHPLTQILTQICSGRKIPSSFFPPLIFFRQNIPGEGWQENWPVHHSYLRQIHSSKCLIIMMMSDREELTIFGRNVILRASFTQSCRRMSLVTRSLVELILLVLFQRAFTSVELVKILADRL